MLPAIMACTRLCTIISGLTAVLAGSPAGPRSDGDDDARTLPGACAAGHHIFTSSDAGGAATTPPAAAVWLEIPGQTAGVAHSLQSAQAAARAHRRRCPDSSVTVHLSGSFELPEPLRFGAADSGVPGQPVRWVGSQAGASQLSGGIRVTGWTKVSPAVARGAVVWHAALPAAFGGPGEQPPNSLWVGERRYQLARLPAASVDPARHGEYNSFQWVQALDPRNATAAVNQWGVVVRSSDLPASIAAARGPLPRHLYMTLFHSYDTSFVRILNVTRFNKQNTTGVVHCCFDRIIQGCNNSAQCDGGGEGCVASGTVTKKYGMCVCHTCEQQGKMYDPHTSSCRPGPGAPPSSVGHDEDDELSVVHFANPTAEYLGAYLSDSHRRFYISNVPEGLRAASETFLVRPTELLLSVPGGVDPNVRVSACLFAILGTCCRLTPPVPLRQCACVNLCLP